MLRTERLFARSLLVLSIAAMPAITFTRFGSLGSASPLQAAAHVKPTHTPRPTATPKPTPAPTATPQPTPSPTASPMPSATAGGACSLFPSTNVWNRDISNLPVRSDSAALIAAIGSSAPLHPDFSSLAWNNGLGYGIPYNVTNASTPTYSVTFQYASESDAGPYPIPANPLIEGGSDEHLLSWDTQDCYLYELYDAVYANGYWTAGSGAIWNLTSNALRPAGWTSADAAGLPILPGLVRYDEVAAGAILHALRFTAPYTAQSYIYPARHEAGCTGTSCLPPMGLRLRLKASVNISGFSAADQVILLALQHYGMLLADNGSPMYVTGAPDARWNDDDLHALTTLHASDFEAVDTSSLVNG
ncbi:MAG TPA: hypothetical protein VKR30_12575 [Candidatus Limnocylindrales bacterium]|nr:hypothetical protein [Candidatus Limnocylindrales bacterium]